ncbi:DMT family transporter [Marinobacterium jannaschii]|uniref:DMT family transporter n=1 Tax=Marinobacterium jannaschii TaxID=64970 RepID=UPI0004852C5E|nr:DMT family transporter [Marinobacterium jannaschii]
MVVTQSRLVALVPFIFVLLWSTGFIGAKYALPYIEPFNLLFIRMLANLAVFALLIRIFRARSLSPAQAMHQMVVGLLVHAGYLGGVFAAIKLDMPAGIAALLVGLQPLLTALIAWRAFSERLRSLQWFGMLLGIVGVVAVLHGNGKLGLFEFNGYAFSAAMVALFAISIGTLYQKRFGAGSDLLTGSFYQYLSTAVVMGLVSYGFETGDVDWQVPLILSLAWLVFGLSVAAILLLLYMIREGESSRVAAYFYLVPPATAIEAWLLFDETFSLQALLGVAITVAGVYMVLRPRRH